MTGFYSSYSVWYATRWQTNRTKRNFRVNKHGGWRAEKSDATSPMQCLFVALPSSVSLLFDWLLFRSGGLFTMCVTCSPRCPPSRQDLSSEILDMFKFMISNRCVPTCLPSRPWRVKSHLTHFTQWGKSDNWVFADFIRQEGTWLKMFPKVMAALVIDRLSCLKWTNLDKPVLLRKAIVAFRQEGG